MASTDSLISMLKGIARRQAIACAVIVLAGVAIGLAVDGTAGLWGALLGGVFAVIFVGTSVISLIASVGREPHLIMLLVLGLWIVKMVVIVIGLVILDGYDFYNLYVLAGVLVAVVLVGLGLDIHGVVTSRLTTVDVPMPRVPDDGQ